MAYPVSNKFRERIYSGGALNRATLTINDILIPNSDIKKITLSEPIIDTTNEGFYLGTFVANKLEIEFKNNVEINFNENENKVFLKIGTKVEEPDPVEGTDGYEDVPIGYFTITSSPEDYYKMSKITCFDSSIKFKNTIDISQFFDETTKDISAEELLIQLCDYFGVTLGSYPTTHPNKNIRIGIFDSTYTGKQYISWISEIMGCNAKIDRDGTLTLVSLKRLPAVTINALKSKSWELGNKFEVSGIIYEDGTRIANYGNDDYNRIRLRLDNPFMLTNDYKNIASNLYDELDGFTMYSLKNENYGDPSLDCWDLIEFELGEDSYVALNDCTLTYEMNIATTINPQIPTKQVEQVTTNVTQENHRAHNMRVVIDQINGSISQLFEDVDDINGDIEENDTWYRNQFTEIRNDINGQTVNISKTGGTNWLMNTAPYRILGVNQLENWTGDIYFQNETNSDSGMALLLKNGIVYQTIETMPNGDYALAFNYKRLNNLANAKVTYNGTEVVLDPTQEEFKAENETKIVIDNGTFTIAFDCDVDDGFEIYNLRLVSGSITTRWSQNQNELKTKSVNIGDGITIDSEQSILKNKIDVSGMVITNKNTNNVMLQVTNENTITNKFRSTDVSEIDGMLVQKIGQQVFITSIVE